LNKNDHPRSGHCLSDFHVNDDGLLHGYVFRSNGYKSLQIIMRTIFQITSILCSLTGLFNLINGKPAFEMTVIGALSLIISKLIDNNDKKE